MTSETITNETVTNEETMVFDAGCGISEDEQQEIYSQINSIAEKNRMALSGAADDPNKKKKKRFKAKKSGGLFPVMVNIIAILALAGGGYALYIFQGKTDAEVREGTMVYNSAERALIEEIRRETSSRLEAKEYEISRITSQLEGVDAELRELYSNSQEFTTEQYVAEDRLKSMQEEYRSALAHLRDERSRILEEARAREASLQAQLESRTRELAVVSEQSAAALDIAQAELDRLSREQNQAVSVEAQMGALFANLSDRISDNRLDEAAGIIRSMRSFLNTPAFQGLRSMQARKELYTQAVNTLDSMVDEARKNQVMLALAGKSSAGDLEKAITELQDENALLKENVAGLTRTVEAATSQGSGLADRLNELGSQVRTLQSQNSNLQRQNTDIRSDLAAKDRSIASLENERNAKDRSIATLESERAARDRTIETLRSENTQAQTSLGTITRERNDLNSRMQTLTTLNSTLSNTIQELTSQLNERQSQE
ncbi:MAG: hypothetical protein FWC24_02720 [Treponema sp.]|nr:hypothetical protein [Treponema sp.]